MRHPLYRLTAKQAAAMDTDSLFAAYLRLCTHAAIADTASYFDTLSTVQSKTIRARSVAECELVRRGKPVLYLGPRGEFGAC